MAVLDPIKVIITNYPENKEEFIDASYNDYVEGFGSRKVPFSKEIYIEKEDFREEANKKFFRLKLNGEVRLKNAYIIEATHVVKDTNGEIIEIHCTYDKDSLSGSGTEESKRRVKGTLHWVSIQHAVKAEVRLYDRLFTDEAPDSYKEKDFKDFINPNSLQINTNAFVEPSLKEAAIGDRFQFQRLGYFNVDNDSTSEQLVFNRTVPLKDSWAKIEQKAVVKQPENKTINEILPLAGKYLKSREEEERLSLVSQINELSKTVELKSLVELAKTANSNKEYLAYLMIFNSQKLQVDFSKKESFDIANKFIKSALQMKNSYVRFQAVDFIGKYINFKDNHIDLLKVMAIEDKNTHIIERLKTILN